MDRANLRARFTGNRQVSYRWVGRIGGGKVVAAQNHPRANILEDTWSDRDVDERVKRATRVSLPVGLLVVSSERSGKDQGYSAGILRRTEKGGDVDWNAVRHVEVREEPVDPKDPKGAKRRVHVVEIAGRRSEYEEVDWLEVEEEPPSRAELAAFSTEELEAELARRRSGS
jgi:hypothetical protein